MSRNITFAILFTLSLTSYHAVAKAGNDQLSSAIKSCEASSRCSYLQPDKGGGMLFTITNEKQKKYIRCASNGECMRVMPRGGKYVIQDISVFLAAD